MPIRYTPPRPADLLPVPAVILQANFGCPFVVDRMR